MVTHLAYADDESIERRMRELEDQLEELQIKVADKRPQVNSFFKDNITLGGFFEPSYTAIAGPDTELQAGSHSHLLGLNISAVFSNKFRFVSQVITALVRPLKNEHNDPRGEALSPALGKHREFGSLLIGSLVAQGYVEYTANSNLSIKTGLGYVPFGYYAQLREPVLFYRRGGPATLRTKYLFTPLWMGINIAGTISDRHAGYNLYTAPSVDESKNPGLGARIWKNTIDDQLGFGLSAQVGKVGTKQYEVLGADLKAQYKNFKLITELIVHITEDETPWVATINPSFNIYEKEILLYLFADFASADQNKTGSGSSAIEDPYKKWEYGGGINWLATSYIRYRAGLTFHDYVGSRAQILGQNRDYTSLDVSLGVAF